MRLVRSKLVFMTALLLFGAGQLFAAFIANVPDTQQPPAGSLGNPVDNACAPTSAENITEYWDVVMSHPNATGVNAGLPSNVVVDYLYYFMDTDNWGSPARLHGTSPQYPPTFGTYNIDIMPGFYEFVRWDATHPFTTPPPPLPLGKNGYDWTFSTDYAVGFPLHVTEIDSGRPDIVCFQYWNPLPTGVIRNEPGLGIVDFYLWGPPRTSSMPPEPMENWNFNSGPEGIGHAVTGVGYYSNFDPDSSGPLPLTDWIICHDNWPTTPVNVAIPWANWKATITADPGRIVQPDSLYWKDYNGPHIPGGYMPDFDQLQDFNGDGWPEVAYCGPVAVANSFWWFQGKYPNRTIIDPLFYPQNPLGFIELLAVLMKTNRNGMPPFMQNGTYVDSMQAGIDHYLRMMRIDDLLYEHTIYRPTFETIESEIERCQDVTLLIGFWVIRDIFPVGPDQWMVTWARTGGHYVTAAGVNSQQRLIGISDPRFDNFEAGVCNGILRGINHNHPAGHNDGVSASHDIYNVNSIMPCSPGGLWELEHPFWHQIGLTYEFARQNEDTLLITIPWPCPNPPVAGTVYSEIEAAVIVSPYEGTPDIDVLPDTLYYVQRINRIQTYLDQIIVCNTGTAPLRVDSITCDFSWVSTSFVPTTIGPGVCDTFDVTINTNGLALGMYNGRFHVYSSDPDEAIVNKPALRIQVVAPDINVAPDSLIYAQLYNTIQTYVDQIRIRNVGGAPLRVDSVKCDLPWITTSFTPITLAPGICDTIDVIVNTNWIIPGNYSGSFHVYSDDPDQPVVNKPLVRVLVTAPTINVNPAALNHSQQTNTVVLYPNDFTISNSGTAPLTYTATNTLAWITLIGMTGNIPPGGTDFVSLNVNTTGIIPGIYYDSVTIVSNDPNTPVLVRPHITIQVTQQPAESLYWKDFNGPENPDGYMPDFDQNQDFNNDGQIDLAYCGPVSVANSLWWFQGKYPDKVIVLPPFYPGNPVGFVQILANMMRTNAGAAPGTYVDSMQAGIEYYLTMMGLNRLLYEHTIYQPTFDTIEAEIERCQDVTLLLGFWYIDWVQQVGPDQWLVGWVRTGGHYVTAHGVNSQLGLIGISDPDNDNFEMGICNGVLRGLNHIHPQGHNDGISASHDVYNAGMPPCSPGGLWELQHPFWRSPHLVQRYSYQNGGTRMVVAPWPCPWIQPVPGAVYTEIEAAVIISPIAGCDFVPGDINGDGNVMGGDVTYGVRYFKGLGNPPPDSCWNDSTGSWLYSAGDANGDCQFRGSDITFLVAYFKGLQPRIKWCPQTPPLVIPPLIKPEELPIKPLK
mgnify:CR=1 FL=1